MAHVPMDEKKVASCRALAASVATDVQRYIDAHTSVGVERTMLRALGVEGLGAEGAPLVNLAVDRYQKAGLLDRGISFFVGRQLISGAKNVQDATERLAYAPEIDEPTSGPTPAEARAALAPHVTAALERIDRAREQREALKARVAPGPAPLKYVIVATGNIYDDVEQAKAAAQLGADVIAVIRSTAQSLLDYVPHGATTEGYGGTYATQENFRIMREALDAESRKLGRYVHLTNYSSGLCMPEIAFMAAYERLDMLLNDAMYGILFRDINMKRTFCDQYFSRRICAFAGIIINTGEDNYITTADADEAAHTVIASQLINETFARLAGMKDELIVFGHSFEIDPAREDTLLR